MIASISSIVEVDPTRGNDDSGGVGRPYRTITAALAHLESSTLIKLAPGLYTKASGEQFPLTLPGGVILDGTSHPTGEAAIISGGGAAANFQGFVAVILHDNAQLRGITVRNSLGNGVLVTNGQSLIRQCLIHRCPQDGLVVTGSAIPQVVSTTIEDNGGPGLRMMHQAKGVVKDCILRRCQTGVLLEGDAAPLIQNNQISDHQVGVLVTGTSSPVLRSNRIIQNRQRGIWLQGNSRPNLGHSQDPANNIVRHNGQVDIHNDMAQLVVAVGNDLLPQRLQGRITLAASQIPEAKAVPPPLLSQPSSGPTPPSTHGGAIDSGAIEQPSPKPSPQSSSSLPKRFADINNHWAKDYIEALADRELIKGYDDGSFRPNTVINRAQFAAMVAASFKDQPSRQNATRFRDVPAQHWASNAITQVQRQGFIGGFPDQTFRPDQPITRGQAITAIAQGLRLAPAPSNLLSLYRDRAQIPSYATDAIAAATQHELVVNHPRPDHLRPLDPITRGEVTTLIYQGLVTQGKASPLQGNVPVQAEIPQGSFPDIKQHWAEVFIQGLLNRNLIRGYDDGTFRPDRPMTRAQFAAVIQSAFQPSPQRAAKPFRDVSPTHWAAQAIQIAYRGSFLSGFPDGSFGPDSGLLRVQIWVALVHGLNLLPRQSGQLNLLARYLDRQAIPDYAQEPVAKATQLKLVVNAPNLQRLNPNQVATRAEISAVVYQTLVYLQRAPRVNNAFIVYP
jgi:parallel beta-helix repeat protein